MLSNFGKKKTALRKPFESWPNFNFDYSNDDENHLKMSISNFSTIISDIKVRYIDSQPLTKCAVYFMLVVVF